LGLRRRPCCRPPEPHTLARPQTCAHARIRTPLPDAPWVQAEAVLDLAAALGIARPNILGWSSGGNVGLVLAALHGDRVGKVASLAGMAGGENTSEWAVRGQRGGGEGAVRKHRQAAGWPAGWLASVSRSRSLTCC
jgi:pimeloyl-ACP methyl ester carboxylesterase